jgi:hypothetical protein
VRREPPPEGSLEKLLTDKQDELRGRPRDWIDDFGDWRRTTDWFGTIVALLLLAASLVWLWMVWEGLVR